MSRLLEDGSTAAVSSNHPGVPHREPEFEPAAAYAPTGDEPGWVGVIANRSSGTGRGKRLVERFVRSLDRAGLASRVAWTPEERSEIVQRSAADPRCRCLVAVGGDGTVSALLNERPRVPLSVLPAGTENLVAQHFGLGHNPDQLAQTIAKGQCVRVDVGQVGVRRFLLMAGFGFDGHVVTGHHEARVTRNGKVRPTHRLAYIWPILRASLFYRFPVITVRICDTGAQEVLAGTTIFLFNAPRYALGLPFAPEALDNDGWLDLVVFRKPGPFQALYYLWKVLRGIHLQDPSVAHRRIKKVEVTAKEAIPVQIDGDPGGYVLPDHGRDSAVQWTVEVVPSAVEVIPQSQRRSRQHAVPLATEGNSR
jgi:diacylglycerol kinase (ATP)